MSAADHLERISPTICGARFDAFYDTWDSLPQLKDCDAVLLLTGKARDDDDSIARLGALHLWFFTLIFPETLVIWFKDKRVAFSARGKKLAYFKELENTPVASQVSLELYARDNNSTASLTEHFTASGLLDSIKKCKAGDGAALPPRIGCVLHPSSLPWGPMAETMMSLLGFPQRGLNDLDDSGINTCAAEGVFPIRWKAVDADLTRLTLRLNETDKEWARLAAVAASRMAREVVINRVVHILDQEIKESHKTICSKAEDALEEPARMQKWKTKIGVDGSALDVHYCLVESGAGFTLDPDAVPSDVDLSLGKGSVTIGLGVKYHHNLANIARTVLMDVGNVEKSMYTAALELQEFIISKVEAGKKFNQIYDEAMTFVKSKHPKLADCVFPEFGGAVGSQLLSPGFKFDAHSNEIIDENMAVSVCVAVPKVASVQAPFAIWLGDTLLVNTNNSPTLWTGTCAKKLDDVWYALEVDKPKEESRAASVNKSKSTPKSPAGPSTRVRTRRAAAGVSQAEQEKMLQKQRELRRKKELEIAERFRDGGVGFARDKKSIRKFHQITAYRDHGEFPKELRPNKVHIDSLRETVLIPIGQKHIPFHVSTLRNVVHQDEEGSKSHSVRIAFNVPGASSTGSKTEESPWPDLSTTENALFLKEITIRSNDANISTLCKNLRELMKRAKTKEQNRNEEDVTQQQALLLNRSGKRLILRHLMVRHGGAHSRKNTGQLEAHVNGFRYSAVRSENIDIIYSNIRHAFFQPVNNEMIVLLHFHLKSPILIQKKKVKDLQFYCEVASQSDDLDARRGYNETTPEMISFLCRRSTAHDPEEILEEQREQEKKKRLNLEFRRFVEQVQELAQIAFEVPSRALAFHGVPRNSSVILMPTQNCLVSLSDWPSFILPMDDVELVSFERVIHGLRHFDAMFVYKDYVKPVQSIGTIPVESLDMLKSWLNDIDCVWYEGKRNLNWSLILKTIRSDIKNFVEDGCFELFLGEDTDPAAKKKKQENRSSAEEDSSDDDDEEYHESSGTSSGEEDSDDEGSGGSGSDEEVEEDDDEDDEEDEEDDDGGSDEELDSDESVSSPLRTTKDTLQERPSTVKSGSKRKNRDVDSPAKKRRKN